MLGEREAKDTVAVSRLDSPPPQWSLTAVLYTPELCVGTTEKQGTTME